jgi:hypothetical protein
MAIVRQSEAVQRKTYFVGLRFALILITGLLGYLETRGEFQMPLFVLLLLAFLSNAYLLTLSPFTFFDVAMQSTILISDTALISCVLLLSRASQEFFLFFFFALLMVAYIENTVLLLGTAGLVALLTLFLPDVQVQGGFFSTAFLRIPFLLATTIFYAYIVLPERAGQQMPTRHLGPAQPSEPTPIPPEPQGEGRMPRVR